MRTLAALALLAFSTLDASAAKPKPVARLDSVLIVHESGDLGKTSVLLFDGGTTQVLTSTHSTDYFQCGSASYTEYSQCLSANEWLSGVIQNCPKDRICTRWETAGVQNGKGKELRISFASSSFSLAPVSLDVPGELTVIGFGNASLKTDKDWKDYADKYVQAEDKAAEQRKQAADAERKKEGDANTAKAIAMLNATQNLHDCLRNLKAGDSASKVYHCGYPDHTNSDLHSDQLVYSDDVYVYIDKATNTVSDVQWKD